MKTRIQAILAVSALALVLTACEEEKTATKNIQSEKATQAANSINFTENAEIDNIKARLELTSKVGALGYVLLINQAGQPIAYYGVKGKVTSGSKRLTPPDRTYSNGNGSGIRLAPSDEGTYGSSDPYVYFWTTSGQYVQWNGSYLYSDQPFRIKVEPLVINIEQK